MARIYAFADEVSPMIDQQIVAMQRNGLQGLEMRGVDGVNVADITLDKAKEVRLKLDAAGLVTWSIGSPIGKINITDDFGEHLDKFKHTLEIAHILGSSNLRMFSFFMPKGEENEKYKNEVIDRLGALVETAKGSGVNLCHENEKGIYGDTAAHCLELLQAVPELKCIFDPANFVQCGEDTLEAWELLGDRVWYMHIKDAEAGGRIVPAGSGIGNIPQIAKAFIANGGKDFTMEPHLTVFEGLAALEQEGETSQVDEYRYPDADTAFDVACEAFRRLV